MRHTYNVVILVLLFCCLSDRIILGLTTMDVSHQDEGDKHGDCPIEEDGPKAEEVDEGSCDGRRYDGCKLTEEIVEAGIDAYRLKGRHLPEHRKAIGDDRDPEDAEEEKQCPEGVLPESGSHPCSEGVMEEDEGKDSHQHDQRDANGALPADPMGNDA